MRGSGRSATRMPDERRVGGMTNRAGRDMNCERLERWLDDGMPPTGEAQAQAHAASCAPCAAALAAARELDARLEAALTAAPAGLTSRIMERISAIEDMRESDSRAAALRELTGGPIPWWARAAADPAAALAFALAALVLWKRDAILAPALALVARAGGLGDVLAGGLASPALRGPSASIARLLTDMASRPEIALGIVLGLAPAAGWLAWRLWRWGEARA